MLVSLILAIAKPNTRRCVNLRTESFYTKWMEPLMPPGLAAESQHSLTRGVTPTPAEVSAQLDKLVNWEFVASNLAKAG